MCMPREPDVFGHPTSFKSSVLGMLMLGALMSLPLDLLARRYGALHLRFQAVAGAASLGFGLWLLGHQAGLV